MPKCRTRLFALRGASHMAQYAVLMALVGGAFAASSGYVSRHLAGTLIRINEAMLGTPQRQQQQNGVAGGTLTKADTTDDFRIDDDTVTAQGRSKVTWGEQTGGLTISSPVHQPND